MPLSPTVVQLHVPIRTSPIPEHHRPFVKRVHGLKQNSGLSVPQGSRKTGVWLRPCCIPRRCLGATQPLAAVVLVETARDSIAAMLTAENRVDERWLKVYSLCPFLDHILWFVAKGRLSWGARLLSRLYHDQPSPTPLSHRPRPCQAASKSVVSMATRGIVYQQHSAPERVRQWLNAGVGGSHARDKGDT